MASIINLEDLPQLVIEKIISFLNHKQLLALEQVSREMKWAVDAHLSTTDHLIIGYLADIWPANSYIEATANGKKSMDGLLTLIKRCGIRLRTIQITNRYRSPYVNIYNYKTYFEHLFASPQFSNICPNVENIIASPYTDNISLISHRVGDELVQEKVLLNEDYVETYANNVKLSTGKRCKLRSISLSYMKYVHRESYQRILNLYSNIEQMHAVDLSENFYKFLPQFIEKGLKDLSIGSTGLNIDYYRIIKKCCNIWKDLRTLRLSLTVQNDDDVAALNKLQLSQNVQLQICIWNVDDCLAQLNENVCNSIINCYVIGSTDYSLMTKLKNLQGFDIHTSEILQVIAKGTFPKLRRLTIGSNLCNDQCGIENTCDSESFLPPFLINKGSQLTIIRIHTVCGKSMHVVWKALKHCRAVKNVNFERVDVDSPLTLTYDDVEAICHLPNLEHFEFSSMKRDEQYDACDLLRQLMERAANESIDFQFDYFLQLKFMPYFVDHQYSLYRIDF